MVANKEPWRVSEHESDVMKTVIKEDEMQAGQIEGRVRIRGEVLNQAQGGGESERESGDIRKGIHDSI